MDYEQISEGEFQEQLLKIRRYQGTFKTARREWEDGDIDWSEWEAFLDSIVGVILSSGSPHADVLQATVNRFHAVIADIQKLDPLYMPELKWGDVVLWDGREYTLHKPIDRDKVRLMSGDSIIDVPWAEVERPE